MKTDYRIVEKCALKRTTRKDLRGIEKFTILLAKDWPLKCKNQGEINDG